MSNEEAEVTAWEQALVEKDLELTRVFSLAIIDDPAILEDIPNGVLLMLMPDDDPEYTAISIERGMAAVAQGRDVYFRRFPQRDSERRVAEREAPNSVVRTLVPH